jgi:hypothetical protein
MPRIRPPRQAASDPADLPVMEDHTPPTEDIEIALADVLGGDAEIDLAPAPEPEPPPPPAPPAPSADDALVRAAEATRRAEELQRANAELIRRDREREEQLTREQTGREDAEYNSVLTAIAAEQGSLAKAKVDYAAAAGAGDWEAAAEAQDAMTAARTQLVDLERGKQSFETRRAEPHAPQRPAPPAAAPPPDFEQKVASLGVPDNAKSWLRQHPELVNDAAKNEELGAAHLYLTKAKKIEPFTQAYFEALDTEFGFKAAPAVAPQPEPQPQPQRRSMPMTAPVSRDVPTVSGQRQSSSKVTLTAEERQIARTSFTAPDMTNEQKELLYARNKQRLAQQRANGAYPQPERN